LTTQQRFSEASTLCNELCMYTFVYLSIPSIRLCNWKLEDYTGRKTDRGYCEMWIKIFHTAM